MADSEFEEFRQIFDKLPSHLKTPTPFYSLVPGLVEEEASHSSKSDSSPSDEEEGDHRSITPQNVIQAAHLSIPLVDGALSSLASNSEDDEIGDGLKTFHHHGLGGAGPQLQAQTLLKGCPVTAINPQQYSPSHGATLKHQTTVPVERRRRKLPEIPKNKKPSLLLLCGQTSLAEELSGMNSSPCLQPTSRSVLARKCGYLLDEDSSPDSDRLHSLGDVDSGHSTAHSPTDFKSISPSQSPFPPPFGGVPYSQLEMLEATHRALHKFIPRHQDEVDLEIGDPLYVQKEAEDLWCEGVNLRTGKQGSFPSAYAVDLEYNDFDPETIKMKRERYLLGYMGSVETLAHKGTGVVCQAVKKIIGDSGESPKAQSCILEISDQGLRMVERSRLQNASAGHTNTSSSFQKKGPCIDYFYSLKNVSFCAFHPRDHRYIGFITKHPTVQRFACHVFKGQESTRPVAEAVGRAFQRFYQKFIETAYPIEDIYIE